MWKKSKNSPTGSFEDSKLVTGDYIIAEGIAGGDFSFSDDPSDNGLSGAMFHVMKVHRNHPIRIRSSETISLNVYPESEVRKLRKQTGRIRMPGDVYENKMDYDLTTFMLVPLELEDVWTSTFPLKDCYHDADGNSSDATLLYLEHGLSMGSASSPILKVSEVMPSQVRAHFYSWMIKGHKINSREKSGLNSSPCWKN